MCGVFGFVGRESDVGDMVLSALKTLEYRGYDSWGMAVSLPDNLFVAKNTGRINGQRVALPKATMGLGHTRWATHGGVTVENAHPHLDCAGRIAVVHNGIIENHEDLRRDLMSRGHQFASETDSEVVAHLVEERLAAGNDLTSAVSEVHALLAGYNAIGLEQRSFEPFRQMLQASMRHAGAIRLDHVMGLKRLYLVPRGFGPRDGVYVPMPFEAMLALTALESDANRCIVIGEDLGTVPEGFRDRTRDWHIWSYLVMMFERDGSGAFHGIEHYQPNALVTFNTHDLATYAGWRHFNDLKQKRALGFDPGETDDDRWRALTMLDQALGAHGIHDNNFNAIAGFLARTRSRLMAVALEDLLGLEQQPNIPGTVDEHPNWRRRMPLCIDEIAERVDVVGLKTAMRERKRDKG